MEIPAQIPLFPLPDNVLLIGVPALYRAFEPRYRALVDSLLEQNDPRQRWLAIPRLVDGWQQDYYGAPPFHPCVALAQVRNIRPASQGEFELVVEGIVRCDLAEIRSHHPYRLARPTLRTDEPVDAEQLALHVHDLLGHVGMVLRVLGDRGQRLAQVIDEQAEPGELVDRLGAALLGDHRLRQDFLEQRSLIARTDLLRNVIHTSLGRGPGMQPSEN